MAVELTESAARHVASMLEKRGQGLGLRLGTKKSGCTGFSYVVDYADDSSENDVVFESHGVKVVVDKQSLQQIDGLEVGERVDRPPFGRCGIFVLSCDPETVDTDSAANVRSNTGAARSPLAPSRIIAVSKCACL